MMYPYIPSFIVKLAFVVFCLLVLLAGWKLVEIALWLFAHVEIGWTA